MLVVDLHAGHGLAGLALLGEDQQVGGPAVVVVGGHQAAAVTLAGLLRHNICCQSLLMFLIMLCTLHTTQWANAGGQACQRYLVLSFCQLQFVAGINPVKTIERLDRCQLCVRGVSCVVTT